MTQRFIAQVQEPSPSPPPSPPPALEWGTYLTVTIAAAAWLGKRAWEYFSNKEEQEASLVKTLVTDLREAQSQLLKDHKDSYTALVQEIKLKESVSQMVALTEKELQRALTAQTSLYTQAIEKLSRMEQKLDALHRRLDSSSSSLEKDVL